jgi:hypothetical protein
VVRFNSYPIALLPTKSTVVEEETSIPCFLAYLSIACCIFYDLSKVHSLGFFLFLATHRIASALTHCAFTSIPQIDHTFAHTLLKAAS